MGDFDDSAEMTSGMMLDGNALAGTLRAIFDVEMTTSKVTCARCEGTSMIGALHVFGQAPGYVLRCPECEEVMLRLVQTPSATLLDARGVMYLSIPS
jgi:hypothetical protein